GKKVGLSSPLPLALRLLEFAGKIERTLDGGKLDSERYLWRKTAGKLAAPAKDHERRVANVVDAFLGFAGPATLAQLAAWSGRAQRDLKAAIGKLDAVPVEVEGLGEAYVRSADLAAKPPAPLGIALVAFEDNYLVNHGVAAVADPKHHAIEADIWGSDKGPGAGAGSNALGKANHVLSRSIVVDRLVAGFWEGDPRTSGAVRDTFDPAPRPAGGGAGGRHRRDRRVPPPRARPRQGVHARHDGRRPGTRRSDRQALRQARRSAGGCRISRRKTQGRCEGCRQAMRSRIDG